MEKRIGIATCIFSLLAASCSNYKRANGLTQYENIDSLTIFAPELAVERNTYKGSFSDDYNTFFFFRKKTKDQEKYIPYQSTFEKGQWNAPQVTEYYDEDYSFTYQLNVPEEDKLIFLSNMRTKNDTTNRPNYNFWAIKQSDGSYGSPQELGPKSLIYNYNSQPSMAKSGSIFFTSDTPDWAHTYSYKMGLLENGTYEEPEPFEPINQWRAQQGLTIYEFAMAPNEDYLIVCIKEESKKGTLNTDLYISYFKNNNWTWPKKLNNGINTAETENFPVITADGKYLIFTRAFSRFYIIPIDVLTELDISIEDRAS